MNSKVQQHNNNIQVQSPGTEIGQHHREAITITIITICVTPMLLIVPIFSELPFDGFGKKEDTSCEGDYDFYLYTEKPEECPTKCRDRGQCSAFTMAATGSVYKGQPVFLCQLYQRCVEKAGVDGTDLYSFEKW